MKTSASSFLFSSLVFLVCFLWVFSKVNADETCSDTIFVGEVGTKVVHEDDEVKVWEMVLQPGKCKYRDLLLRAQ